MQLNLNYQLTTPEERLEFINNLIKVRGKNSFSTKELEIMANYLLIQERRSDYIVTQNRSATIKKRETSYEGLIDKLEQGEAGIQPLIANDKNIIFTPPISITEEEVKSIPHMRQLKEAIAALENANVSGRSAYIAKKASIELRQDQYVLKQFYKPPTRLQQKTKSSSPISWITDYEVAEDQATITSVGTISLMNPKHVEALLVHLKFLEGAPADTDIYYLVEELKVLLSKLDPVVRRLAELKIAEASNQDIQTAIAAEFDTIHSLEYLSSLWRNKVPKMIAAIAKEEWLEWYYTFKEKGVYKTCTRCGKAKLASNLYFSRNRSDVSGLYSICKDCRNSK